MAGVGGVAFEHHQLLVVEDQIGALVVFREHGQGIIEFGRQPPGRHVAGGGREAELHQPQHRRRQGIAHTSDGAHRSAPHDSMEDLRIHADHQAEVGVAAGDVFGRIGERGCAAKLLEANEVRKLRPQVEKQWSLRLEAVIGAVVDHGREAGGRPQDAGKMVPLRRGRSAPGEHPGDHHQPRRADLPRMGRVLGGTLRILSSGAHDHGNPGLHEAGHALLPLPIGQQWPVAH